MESTYASTFDPLVNKIAEDYCPFLLRELERIDLCIQRYVNLNRDYLDGHVLDNFLLNDFDAKFYSSNPCGIPYFMRNLGGGIEHKFFEQQGSGGIFGKLVSCFGLSPFEADILLLGLLPHFDNRYLSLFSALQRSNIKNLPTLELIKNLFRQSIGCDSRLNYLFFPESSLITHNLIFLKKNSEEEDDVWGQTMYLSAIGVFHYLIGNHYLSSKLHAFARWHFPERNHILSFPKKLLHALRIQKRVDKGGGSPVIILEGDYGSGQLSAIKGVAAKLNFSFLELNVEMMPENIEECIITISEAIREVRMRSAVLVITNLEFSANKWNSETPIKYVLNKLKEPGLSVVIVSNNYTGNLITHDVPQLVVRIEKLSIRQKYEILKSTMDAEFDKGLNISEICRRYNFSYEDLPVILQEAKNYRHVRDIKDKVKAVDLNMAFRYHARKNFGKLAKRIEPRRTFDDLIVSDEIKKQLCEVLIAAKHREKVLESGFANKIGLSGRGISALFSGYSGTGKTLAAEVIANHLGVDLIKIDLSNVVDKYIGETEKNISKIFDLAERDSAVIFFDEADALFGKRSVVTDSKDRHANIEVAYLLQRLEDHPGLVILATNNRNHLDEAFSRRFTFIIPFTFPDVTIREELWRNAWPDKIKISKEIDFFELANKAELTGGNIRNIALIASWLAAEENVEIGQKHISLAIERELKKTGHFPL